ncbi:hypothetical protein [Lapillicoccus sp.]|uniref:hypothetical protein n=1 Tax=Lapillicoccus sp. TaxID=1909287 RepID=UPI0039834C64
MVWHSSAVSVRDGRVLEVSDTGPGPTRVRVLHHGTPMAFPRLGSSSGEHDIRLVTFARPGYRTSTRPAGAHRRRRRGRHPGRSRRVEHRPGDDGGRLGRWTARHRLCPLLPDRTEAVASICGVAPYDADGPDFLAGMGQDDIAEFTAVLAGEAPLRSHLDSELPGLREITLDQLVEPWGSSCPPSACPPRSGRAGAT